MPRLPASQRRDQLAAVARELFARDGFHATSMHEVAEAAGVTKPVLYQHFASKRQLYLDLLADVGEGLIDAIGKATASVGTPQAKVEQGFRAYFRFVDEDRSSFTLLFGGGARRDAEFAEAIHRIEASVADAVAPLIDADIDPVHRRVVAYALLGLAEGTSRHWVDHDLDLDPDVLAAEVADLAWGGLRSVRRVEPKHAPLTDGTA